ncbi:MAG: class I adenylate-forming enzyme family protein [Pseudomonadota bacterium]
MQTTPKSLIDNYTAQGWWGDDTLHTLLQNAVSLSPDQLALADPQNRGDLVGGDPKRLTYSELETHADDLAARLFAAGLRQGDIVLLQMPNVVEIVLAYLAAARLGLIVSPLAMQYGQHELKQFADTVAPKAYIGIESFMGQPFAAEQADGLPEGCAMVSISGSEQAEAVDKGDYQSYMAGLSHDANDIFTICWTSGTTGRSKGVPRSHNHWRSSTLASEDAIRLAENAIMLNPFPFVNMAAIGGFLFYWLKVRATMILHHPFDPMVFLSQLQNEKVEYTIAPPAVLTRLLQTKDQIKAGFDLSALRIIGSGSAPLSPHMISGFKDEFGIDVVNIFGSNEGMAFLSGPEDVVDTSDRAWFFPRFGRAEHQWGNRIATQVETKLVDTETGAEITEPGQPGECLIRGTTVFDGYYQAPEDNASAFTDDGYFRSGDLFEIAGDNNQYYRFVGRCKSLIVRGGMNISPEELDEVIEANPDVIEAAVNGYADEVMGEKVAAFVVLAEGKSMTLDDLTAYLAEKKVAKFKWPEQLTVLEALPRNAMNKVMRSQLS